jgi:HEAT repeats
MKWRWTLLALTLLPLLPALAPAGIFFSKKPKPEPAQHVPELLAQVKGDGDENRRAAAAEELRQYDAGQFAEIIPVLIDVLLHDPKPGVRAEAAQSLGRLRPLNQQAGWALEQAVNNDASMRVRLQARSSLLHYYMAGYHGGKKEETPANEPPNPPGTPPAVKTTGPTPQGSPAVRTMPGPVPVQSGKMPPVITTTPPQPGVPVPQPRITTIMPQTPPPPLADPPPGANLKPVPVQTPTLQPAPSSGSGQGPDLGPP